MNYGHCRSISLIDLPLLFISFFLFTVHGAGFFSFFEYMSILFFFVCGWVLGLSGFRNIYTMGVHKNKRSNFHHDLTLLEASLFWTWQDRLGDWLGGRTNAFSIGGLGHYSLGALKY
jgi:hypothetical protein